MTVTRKIRVGIAGCTGRVGALLVAELRSASWPDLVLAGGSASTDPGGLSYPVTISADELFGMADVVVDFTNPQATARHAWLAAKHGRPLVIGTTGLDAAQEHELHDAATKAPILYAANMSIGVTLLAALVEQTAASLGSGWDIQIAETHHRHKKDAPSGTALMLGSVVGKRPVGYASQRGGDVVGEHTVTFYGAGERVSLTHIATDRVLFARGALNAARWLTEKPPGFYTMRDTILPDASKNQE